MPLASINDNPKLTNDEPTAVPARHTFVVSDLHLTEAEEVNPQRPLWKRYKQRDLFIDHSFSGWLSHAVSMVEDEGGSASDMELVLAGDIFDFDAVLSVPMRPPWPVHWLERRRGLEPQEAKSRYKIELILHDHAVWVEALKKLISAGGQVVFIVGNHDLELQWPSVQQAIASALEVSLEDEKHLLFVEWFIISGDTLIEHGNQYDAYCVCSDPVNPLIERAGVRQLRLPFGNLASRFLLNGMGLFNPHVESTFVMSFRQYVVFFLRYVLSAQPLLLWTWFWGAMVTLQRALVDGLHPAVRDPVTFATRLDSIARRAHSSVSTVLALRELHVHTALLNPIKIMRELWLDRALLVIGVAYGSFQLILFVNAFVSINLLWSLIPLALALPSLMFYAADVQTDVYEALKVSFHKIPIAAQIAGVTRVIHGHTHREVHTYISGVEHINTGTWSPAYHDPECTKPFGRKCFVWLSPTTGGARRAQLYEWANGKAQLLSGKPETGEVHWKLRHLSTPPPPPGT